MKLQIFIRSWPHSDLRERISGVTYVRWRMFADADVRWIGPKIISDPYQRFHWKCREYAEANSTADYLYGDDDILPIDANFVRHFIEDWAKCPPDVVMLGSVSAIWCERNGDGVGEMREGPVGGLCMIRRGVIPWHEFSGPANQDDGEIADWIRSHGYRTMVSPRLVRNHVGYGLSELNRNCWMRC